MIHTIIKYLLISTTLFFCSCHKPKTDIITPAKQLIERQIGERAQSIHFEYIEPSDGKDIFEVIASDGRLTLRGSSSVAICYAFHTYMKEACKSMKTWSGEHITSVMPWPDYELYEQVSPYELRYFLNVCTFGYTTPYWDWERWEKEIDWMALHGINLSLALTGTESVWRNVLLKLGYTKDEINEFVAGPGFTAWWLMNNLEGWGGSNPESWYTRQEKLQKKIVKRMREYGIEPVLPGYCGMVPHNAKEKLGLNVADPGFWCSYHRPAFLQPEDERFEEISALYYRELTKLYGKTGFYAIDPFHEGGSTQGVNLDAAGKAIMKAMKKTNPDAVWVAQAWQDNPRTPIIEHLEAGDLLVLDLHSECRPQWGDPASEWCRKGGYGQHEWVYCMLLNFGGNIGLHGKMDALIDGFYDAKADVHAGRTLRGVGMTPEGIENNPVMYELVMELPWREHRFTRDEWLKGYVYARYGVEDEALQQVWDLLGNGIYNSPKEKIQQGTHESVFCARPGLDVYQVSSWSEMKEYYNPQDVIEAARLMVSVADKYQGNNNFEFDLVDVLRQALAEKGRLMQKVVTAAFRAGDKQVFELASQHFLHLILLQDQLLGTRKEFKVGTWIEAARSAGQTQEEKALYEWNARVQITTWGNRVAADQGGLRDYAHKEWNGILKDFYFMRWKAYFDYLACVLDGKQPEELDFYTLEEAWTKETGFYSSIPEGNTVVVAKNIFEEVF